MEYVEIGHVGDRHAGIGKGEQRHYQEVDPRAEQVLLSVGHTYQVAGGLAQLAQHVPLGPVGEAAGLFDGVIFFQLVAPVVALAVVVLLGVARGGGDEEGHHHAGHRGVDAGIVEQHPKDDGGNQICPGPLFVDKIQYDDERHYQKGYQQQVEVDGAAVEYGHYEDCYQVVRYGKGCQEHLQRDRDLVAQDGQYAHRESDIGSRRDAPAGGCCGAFVDECIYQRRDYYSAKGRYYRHYRLFRAAQLAESHFTLDLQAHGEEEYHHQDVVDELLHRHILGEGYSAAGRGRHREREAGFEYMVIGIPGPRQVRQQHRHHHASQQDDALRPGLFLELPRAVLHMHRGLRPRIYRYKFHIVLLFEKSAVSSHKPFASLRPSQKFFKFSGPSHSCGHGRPQV